MITWFKVWLPLAVVTTALIGVMNLVVQQDLRQSANDPQIQIAQDAAAVLGQGQSPNLFGKVDIAKSLASYVVVYDAAGQPVAGTGFLNDQLPTLPAGVFDFAQTHVDDRLTWQPKPGVRSAIVVVHFSGQQQGFVMAGRSLREVEIRESNLNAETSLGWIATLIASSLLTLLLEKLYGRRTSRAS